VKSAWLIALCLVAGCASFDSKGPSGGLSGTTRTFAAPIARVKPAFVSTLAQMGMPISAIETRGGTEVLKAGKADKRVEIEIERLSPASTRVRVTGSDHDQIMRETEKRISGG
jgi:hypothetical protein